MGRYIARRLGFLLLTLLLTSLIVFAITQLLPGDVARVVLGREAGEAQLAAFREEFGLNDPLPLQYLSWLGRFRQRRLGQLHCHAHADSARWSWRGWATRCC